MVTALPKLKRRRKDEPRDPYKCAVTRCDRPSEVIDAAPHRWREDVPLCSRHWRVVCEVVR
jgi:hypothetical protein